MKTLMYGICCQIKMKFENLLKKQKFGQVLEFQKHNSVVLDLSRDNAVLANTDLSNPKQFEEYILDMLANNNAVFGIGKYNEDRQIYDHSKVFNREQKRTIHLGIDLWTSPGTKISAPLNGKLHSFQNNDNEGDYGPTIIIEHNIQDMRFFTLYGHLSISSLDGLEKGMLIKKGQVIGMVGNYPINGNWPPHLHFQIIRDIGEWDGDFPGVCSDRDREKFLRICPDPNLILAIYEV